MAADDEVWGCITFIVVGLMIAVVLLAKECPFFSVVAFVGVYCLFKMALSGGGNRRNRDS